LAEDRGYSVGLRGPAKKELEKLRVFEQRRISEAIRQNLTYEPLVPSRNRKELVGIRVSFDHVPPLWELRVGEYRVFYDVNEDLRTVTVRSIRPKPSHATTEDIVL